MDRLILSFSFTAVKINETNYLFCLASLLGEVYNWSFGALLFLRFQVVEDKLLTLSFIFDNLAKSFYVVKRIESELSTIPNRKT